LTPIVRTTHLLDPLPDPIEAYIRYVQGFSNFCVFPWSGFVFAGAVVGVLLDGARSPERESRVNAWLFACGATLTAFAYGISFLPSPYTHSEFWGGSPAYFALRSGIMTLVIPVAYAWERLAVRGRWSPMEQLGRSSLFIYWIHIEMVYGLISLRIHKTLTHRQAWAAYAAFVVFMLLCSIAKDRVVRWKTTSSNPESSG
jgi:fucose 4-O-acetylase-like acetyltransferase